MKNIEKTNKICYGLGGIFRGGNFPPKGPEKNTAEWFSHSKC